MQILVSDANVLIDFDRVGLIESFFALDFEVRVLDVLFQEELAERHGHLETLGLKLESLPSDSMHRAQELIRTHRRPGRIDLLSLALAEHLECPLLTGDADLRTAAESEAVEVHGSLWVAQCMMEKGLVSDRALRRAFEEMRRSGRRLPWRVAAEIVNPDAG